MKRESPPRVLVVDDCVVSKKRVRVPLPSFASDCLSGSACLVWCSASLASSVHSFCSSSSLLLSLPPLKAHDEVGFWCRPSAAALVFPQHLGVRTQSTSLPPPPPAVSLVSASPSSSSSSILSFCELCCGLGGFRLGLEALGPALRSTFASEIDREAVQTYVANFGDAAGAVFGDMTLMDFSALAPVTLVTAGFPCQPFTGADPGAEGFADLKNGLIFFHVARAVKQLRAECFLLENVPHLLEIKSGNVLAIDVISQVFEDLGFEIFYKVIDCGMLLAQSRRRLFIVGFREGSAAAARFQFPELPNLNLVFGNVREPDNHNRTVLTKKQRDAMKQPGLVNDKEKTQVIQSSYKNRHRFFSQFVEMPNGELGFMTPREVARLQGIPNEFKLDAW